VWGEVWPVYVAPVIDVLFVAAIVYSLIMLARGTRAWQILMGLIVFGLIYGLSAVLHFRTLHWLLRQLVPMAPVALVILFYPELRYALEEMGRVQFWRSRLYLLPKEDIKRLVNEIVQVATELSNEMTGALIVMEREEGLDDLIGTGTRLDAQVSSELLSTLFHRGTTLHDGAVIIRGDRIVAAGCLLPLTENPSVSSAIHTRHRAAIGITEDTDAVAVVVSEETGLISFVKTGKIKRGIDATQLRTHIANALQSPANAKNRRKEELAGAETSAEVRG